MKVKSAPSLKDPTILYLSFFGLGFFPKAPGTIGTLGIIPLLYYLSQEGVPKIFFIPFLIITTCFTCFVAESVQKKMQLHDPQWIVIDEVLGMSVTWLFSTHTSLLAFFIMIVLFRFFDIFKIWPASYFDKDVLHGSGTILDDIVSGLYAGLSYLLIEKFLL